MQLYATDKAIEFNAAFEDLQRAISALEEIGIDVSRERNAANKIKEDIDNTIFNSISVSAIEEKYQQGLTALSAIHDELKKHEVYYMSYTSAEDIQNKLNNCNMNSEALRAFAGVTISLLKQINSSDTRSFKSEEKVVDKVYQVAYNMIKMEILSCGESSVLNWVKEDKVAASFINSLIEEDAEKLSASSDLASDISQMIKKAKGTDFNGSYLDEGLILFLAMHDTQNVETIESLLMSALNDVYSSKNDEEVQQGKNSIIQDKIDELSTTIKKSRIYKELMLALGLLAAVVSIKQGANAIAKHIGHEEYRTHTEYYSSVGAEAPSYPEYMEPIKNFSKTTLTAQGVWTRSNIFYGEYERDIVEYDLSKVDLENLADYDELDFSEIAKIDSDTEKREALDPSELYEEAIVEITRIIQDENDEVFVPHEESQKTFILVASIIDALLLGVGSSFILSSVYKKLKNNVTSRKAKKTELANLARGLREYELLTLKNKYFRERFIKSYQKFEKIINNKDLKKGYTRILQQQKKEN